MLIYVVYTILSPILWLLIITAAAVSPKIRLHLREQKQSWYRALELYRMQARRKKVIVLHAASAGEFEQIKPLLNILDRDRFFILQSFMSPTIYQKEASASQFDAAVYSPFDLPWSVNRFFRLFKPVIHINTRHDIWPHQVVLGRRNHCRMVLINANIHEHSIWTRIRATGFSRWLFDRYDLITTGSSRLEGYLLPLITNSDVIHVTGDTRFDQVIQRREQYGYHHLSSEYFKTANIIFGSVIPSDYPVILGALGQMFPQGIPDLTAAGIRLILVPHETDTETLDDLERRMSAIQLQPQRYSNTGNDDAPPVLMVDAVGILADLYAHAELAYIGAGFGAGVHSVIEPAVHGCAAAFGPNIHILDEAVIMDEQGIGKVVHSPEDLIGFFNHNLNATAQEIKERKQSIQNFVFQHQDAAQRILRLIRDMM